MIIGYALWQQILYRTVFSKPKVNQFTKTAILHRKKIGNLIAGIIIGFTWAFWQSFFTQNLPQHLFNQHLLLEAKVIEAHSSKQPITDRETHSAKQSSRQRQKLTLAIQKIYANPFTKSLQTRKPLYQTEWLSPKVQLSIYAYANQMPEIRSGETWLLAVKIKAPYASQNPYARDYESYLFQQGIQAKGYLPKYSAERYQAINKLWQQFNGQKLTLEEPVRNEYSLFAFKLSKASFWDWRSWRSRLHAQWQQRFIGSEFWRIYQALLLGERSQMTPEDWQLLQNTGTSHLMAISGLHLAIMALIGAGLFRGIWWLGAYRIERVNLPTFSAVGALILATAYLMISGMAIPTQRAWIMVMVFLLFIFIRRKFQPWSALAIAAFLVLLFDSSAVLSAGFWLSFVAVALIFYSLPWLSARPRWQQMLILQTVLTIGLAPLLIWQFSQLPMLSFLANIVAIPIVSFLALPLLFVSAAVAFVSPSLFSWLLVVSEFIWQKLWGYLKWLQTVQTNLPFNTGFSEQSLIWVLLIYAVLFLTLKLAADCSKRRKQTETQSMEHSESLQGARKRNIIKLSGLWMLACLLAVLTFQSWQKPRYGEFWLTLFDTGQGLALSVETAEHRLIYDAGPKWGQTSAAQFAVIPYWQKMGSPPVNSLMISHSDSDHAGGLETLVQQLPINKIVSGQPDKVNRALQVPLAITQCYQGQFWQWDGIGFEVLAPKQGQLPQIRNDNDFSCVLKISVLANPEHSVLVTGDIGMQAEVQLITDYQQQPSKLRASILLAGHHGSRYSSSASFIEKVNPDTVLFAAGYQNHFGFPSDQVLQRIDEVLPQAKRFNTACSGALRFAINAQRIELMEQTRKRRLKWYYQRCKQEIK